MDHNHCPVSANSELGFAKFPSPGSSPDIDLSGAANSHSPSPESGPLNWESDWIDLGGEG